MVSPFKTTGTGADPIRKIRSGLMEICRENEIDPLDFSQANPVGQTDPAYAAASQELLRLEALGESPSNAYAPSEGLPEFREAIAEFERRVNGLETSPDHIIAVPGAATGVATLLRELGKQKGNVVLIPPFFPPYRSYALSAGLTPKTVEFTPDEEQLAERLTGAIDENTRAVIINSPNNPCGAIYSERFLGQIGERANEHGQVLLISDEVYRHVVLPGNKWVPVTKALNCNNTAVVHSSAKDGRIAGCRIGHIALNPNLPNCREVASSLANNLPQVGIVQAHTREQLAISKCRLPLAVDWTPMLDLMGQYAGRLASAGYEILPPSGGLFICVESPDGNGDGLHERLLQEGVGTVPGKPFGIESYVRMAFCGKDAENIDEAMDRIARVRGSYS